METPRKAEVTRGGGWCCGEAREAWTEGGEWTGSCSRCAWKGLEGAGLRTGHNFTGRRRRVFLGRPGGVGPGQHEGPDLAGPSTPRGGPREMTQCPGRGLSSLLAPYSLELQVLIPRKVGPPGVRVPHFLWGRGLPVPPLRAGPTTSPPASLRSGGVPHRLLHMEDSGFPGVITVTPQGDNSSPNTLTFSSHHEDGAGSAQILRWGRRPRSLSPPPPRRPCQTFSPDMEIEGGQGLPEPGLLPMYWSLCP